MTDLFGNTEIRALTWKQPFASMMLHGKKETRTWSTDYRGIVLICAGKQAYSIEELVKLAGEIQTKRIVEFNWNKDNIFTHNGFAIAIGELVNCYPMEKKHEDDCYVKYRLPWTEDRLTKKGTIKEVRKRLWVHEYKNVKPIEQFAFKGCQGWRKISEEVINKIKFI